MKVLRTIKTAKNVSFVRSMINAGLVVCLVAVAFSLAGCGGSSSSSSSEYGRITGKVVPTQTIQSMASTTSTVMLEGTDMSVEAEVGQNFTIDNVPVGTYNIIARTTGMAKSMSVKVEKGKTASIGEIKLVPVAKISGRITDSASDAPIADAIVTAEMTTTSETAGLPATWVTTTDSDGKYSINDLPAGSYCLDITKNGYKSVIKQFQSVTSDVTCNESLALIYPLGQGKITGAVYYKTTSGTLQPVSGVKVTLYQANGTVSKAANADVSGSRATNEWNHTRTKADGTFELSGVPFSSYTLVTGPLGKTSYSDSVNPTSSKPLEYYYTFKPADLLLAQ
ncbi:MAG: carboxypeptidase regulatory-like domain-containing protein [Armatimonadota bacterium]